MAKKMPIRIQKHYKATDGTYDYVRSEAVPPGEIWCIQGLSYENETGARGTFRRYIEGGAENMPVAEHAAPGAGELIFTDEVFYLRPGERIAVRQATCTAADVLSLYAHGYKVFGAYIPGGEGDA